MLIFQKRRKEPAAGLFGKLARRATDTHLRGMQVEDDNSEQAWQDWQAALVQQELDFGPTEPAPPD